MSKQKAWTTQDQTIQKKTRKDKTGQDNSSTAPKVSLCDALWAAKVILSAILGSGRASKLVRSGIPSLVVVTITMTLIVAIIVIIMMIVTMASIIAFRGDAHNHDSDDCRIHGMSAHINNSNGGNIHGSSNAKMNPAGGGNQAVRN